MSAILFEETMWSILPTPSTTTKKEVEFRGVFKIDQTQEELPWVLVFGLDTFYSSVLNCRAGVKLHFLNFFTHPKAFYYDPPKLSPTPPPTLINPLIF